MMTKNEKILLAYTGIWVIILVICISTNINLRQELNETEKSRRYIQEELLTAQNNLGIETKKNIELQEKLDIIAEHLDDTNAVVAYLKNEQYALKYLGDFKITHYCCETFEHICGTGTGITASGTQVTAGRTVAVDPKVIPYGTQLYIEGYGWRIAEDCGGEVKNAQIDIAVETHVDALAMGVTSGGVWILVEINS